MLAGKFDNPMPQSLAPKTAARKAYQKPTLAKSAVLSAVTAAGSTTGSSGT